MLLAVTSGVLQATVRRARRISSRDAGRPARGSARRSPAPGRTPRRSARGAPCPGPRRPGDRAGICVHSSTTVPAATREPVPTTAPFRTVAFMPIRQSSSTVQPCTTAAWPTLTPAPINAGKPKSVCTTTLSCRLLPAPSSMRSMSARTTAPKKTLASAAMVASPMTVAVGASHADRWTVGAASPNGRIRALTSVTLEVRAVRHGSRSADGCPRAEVAPPSRGRPAQRPRRDVGASGQSRGGRSPRPGRDRPAEDHPLALLGMASGLLNALDPRNDNPFDRTAAPERPPLGDLLDWLAGMGEPEAAGLALAMAHLGTDDLARMRTVRDRPRPRAASAAVAGGAGPARGGAGQRRSVTS